MKKLISLLMVVILSVTPVTVFANDAATDHVPMRAILEASGWEVDWDAGRSAVIVILDNGSVLEFLTNAPVAYINGEPIDLPEGAVLVGNTASISLAVLNSVILSALTVEGHLGFTVGAMADTARQLANVFDVAGMTVALIDVNNDFIWTHEIGYADTSTGRLVDENTIFGVGSVSKLFTAVAVMQLVEQGLVDLDEPLVTYLPEFFAPPTVDEDYGDYSAVTVRMLLAHASGLMPDISPSGVVTLYDYNPNFTDNFLEIFAEFAMITPEGTMFAYSNSNYNLLGLLVASFTDYDSAFEGFESYMRSNILDPLGMNNSTFILTDDFMPRVSANYRNSSLQEDFLFYNFTAAGGLNSDTGDMLRFMEMILNGGILDGVRILETQTLNSMLTIQDFELEATPDRTGNMRPGLGFQYAEEMSGFTHWGHGGTLVHHHSQVAFNFEHGLGVFVSTNSISGIALAQILAPIVLLNAIAELTGEAPVPESDLSVAPIELTFEELQIVEGLYTLAGSPELMRVEASVAGGLNVFNLAPEPLWFIPLSDGSFVSTADGLRFWFVPFEDEMLLYMGEFQSTILGARLNLDLMAVPEGFADWTGVYTAIMDDPSHVSIIFQVEVGIDPDFDFAYLRIHTLHELSVISPLIHIENFDFLGGITFEEADDQRILVTGGMRFKG